MGMPADIVAPTGGRAMIIRSTDEGKTWSKPATLIDTPDDDRHPAWVELPDGTLLCSLFTYSGRRAWRHHQATRERLPHRQSFVRSTTARRGTRSSIRPPSPFLADESDGPMVLLKDGSVLLTISGAPKEGGPSQAAVFTSQDRGATWQLGSVIKADHDLDEANATQLPDGRLVMMARPEGDICWSRDQGRTWTAPVTFGMRMYAPSLYVAPRRHAGLPARLLCAWPRRLAADFQHRWRPHLDCAGEGPRLSRGQLLRIRQGDGAARWLAVRHRPGHRRAYHQATRRTCRSVASASASARTTVVWICCRCRTGTTKPNHVRIAKGPQGAGGVFGYDPTRNEESRPRGTALGSFRLARLLYDVFARRRQA